MASNGKPTPFASLPSSSSTSCDSKPSVAQPMPTLLPRADSVISIPTKLLNLKLPPQPPSGTKKTLLEDGYQPQPSDVICTRDRDTSLHVGNQRLRHSVESRADRYAAAEARLDKSAIIAEIFHEIRSSGGKFIRSQETRNGDASEATASHLPQNETQNPVYFDIGKKKSIEKIGKTMRSTIKDRKLGKRRNSWTADGLNVTETPSAKSAPAAINDGGMLEGHSDVALPFVNRAQDHGESTSGFAVSDMKLVEPPMKSFPPPLTRRQTWSANPSPALEDLNKTTNSWDGDSPLSQEWDLKNEYDGFDALSQESMSSDEWNRHIWQDEGQESHAKIPQPFDSNLAPPGPPTESNNNNLWDDSPL